MEYEPGEMRLFLQDEGLGTGPEAACDAFSGAGAETAVNV
jgi:hypothetical protein